MHNVVFFNIFCQCASFARSEEHTAELDLGPFSVCMLEFSLMRLINVTSLTAWANSCWVNKKDQKRPLPLFLTRGIIGKKWFHVTKKKCSSCSIAAFSRSSVKESGFVPLFSAWRTDWWKRQKTKWNRVTVYSMWDLQSAGALVQLHERTLPKQGHTVTGSCQLVMLC